MATWLEQLSQKRFLLITGKGGTGKSVLAAALAMALSSRGKTVHLVEMGRSRDQAFMRLHELLGLPGLEHIPCNIKNPTDPSTNFFASRINPGEALVEYIGMKLYSKRLTNLLLGNRVTAAFLDVVPGLSDIVCLGKLWNEITSKGAAMDPDLVILDAPASGHALSLLHSPQNFSRLTKAGPLFADASAMAKFFSDPQSTQVIYCSLPEEMPFQEAVEYDGWIREQFAPPMIFVNKCFPLSFSQPPLALSKNSAPEILRELAPAWDYSRARYAGESSAMEEFRKAFPEAQFLPYFFPAVHPLDPVPSLVRFIKGAAG